MVKSISRLRLALTAGAGCAILLSATAWAPTAASEESPKRSTLASADSPGSAASLEDVLDDPRLLAQEKAVATAQHIQEVTAEGNLTGFTGTRVAPDAVTLYWKGELPAAVRDVVDTAEPVTVAVVSVGFSAAELDAAAQALMDNPPPGITSLITEVGFSNDFAGLRVATETALPARSAAPETTADGIPLRYDVAPQAVAAAGRWDDNAPFWGGGLIVNGNSACSTAFSVVKPSGTDGLLTARHCGKNKQWKTPTGTVVGTSGDGSVARDAVVITGKSYQPYVFKGPYNSTDVNKRFGVRNIGHPSLDQYVVASGAYSGASTIRVGMNNQYANIRDFGRVGPGAWAKNTGGVASVGHGDSGGPLAGNFNSAKTSALAYGIISAIDRTYLGSCVGYQYNGRECSTRSFHPYVTNAGSTLNFSIMKAP
ncbi:hypothetical protein [Streptomyces phytophilus]|uniref:hypothetical protein n=1 Tax=Streptomyces phytophilus TaxID=722715 RepID=UPI0015F07AB3|nr:hypothetical protein [Streptomyces phytophilus]